MGGTIMASLNINVRELYEGSQNAFQLAFYRIYYFPGDKKRMVNLDSSIEYWKVFMP